MDNLYLLIVLMGVVTFVPRIVPMMCFGELRLNKFFEGFFYYLPYAMLSALIFPSVLSSCGSYSLSMIGAAGALMLSFMNLNPTLVVAGSVGIVYAMQVIF